MRGGGFVIFAKTFDRSAGICADGAAVFPTPTPPYYFNLQRRL
jgi:hypothetical protein